MLDNFRAWNRSRKIKRLKNKNLRKTIFGFDLVGPEAMINGHFETLETSYLYKELPKYNTFINIGANFGYYCCIAQQLGIKTYAFEPVPVNFEILIHNLVSNNFTKNITLFQMAAGDKSGFVEIFGEGTGASIIPGWARNPVSLSHTVPMAKIDDLINPSKLGGSSFILIDVEGFEYEVLAGAEELISNKNLDMTWLIEIGLFRYQSREINPNYLKTFDIFFRNNYKLYALEDLNNSIQASEIMKIFESKNINVMNTNFLFKR